MNQYSHNLLRPPVNGFQYRYFYSNPAVLSQATASRGDRLYPVHYPPVYSIAVNSSAFSQKKPIAPVPRSSAVKKSYLTQSHVNPNRGVINKKVVPDNRSEYLVMSIIAQSNALKRLVQLYQQTEQKITQEVSKIQYAVLGPVIQSKIGLIRERLNKFQAVIKDLENRYEVGESSVDNVFLTNINTQYKSGLLDHKRLVLQLMVYCKMNERLISQKIVSVVNYWEWRVGYLLCQFERAAQIPHADGFLLPTGGPLSRRKHRCSFFDIGLGDSASPVKISISKKSILEARRKRKENFLR